eukprot:TRINITY_DN12087_c0_g1_i1.p1 TRINITY_DN12087_c0_g1~~TRINITY_DN12087_c0_g1_i1.p1  ORF type:complete len:155 (-),score=32.22 TRINITY_DN12087_c0_g1_i1:74-538(-)
MVCVGLAMLVISVVVRRGAGVSCYTNVEKTEEEYCPKYDGWETCYTTYDQNGATTGRGCSKKDYICIDEKSIKSKHLYGFMSSRRCPEQEKIYIHDCENTMKDEKFERVCYCRYRLCNHGYSTYYGGVDGVRTNSYVVMGSALGIVLLGKLYCK